MRKQFWLNRIKASYMRESAVTWAVETCRRLIEQKEALVLSDGMAPRNAGLLLKEAAGKSGARVVLLTFAEFQEAIREVYRHWDRKQTVPDAYPLMESLAKRVNMPDSVREAAHEVRDARNAFVHNAAHPHLFPDRARKAIATFLSWPPDWSVS